jgi:hypothetical protein
MPRLGEIQTVLEQAKPLQIRPQLASVPLISGTCHLRERLLHSAW